MIPRVFYTPKGIFLDGPPFFIPAGVFFSWGRAPIFLYAQARFFQKLAGVAVQRGGGLLAVSQNTKKVAF